MQHKVIDTKDVVIRFCGDSGDGMQLTGTLFADASALYGNEISTFPDYPAFRSTSDPVKSTRPEIFAMCW